MLLPHLIAGLLLIGVHSLQAESAPKTRLFILSGQSNMKHLDPEVTFTPELKKAFPTDDLIVVKLAESGQLIRRWYRDWQPATGEPPKGTLIGDIYANLLKKVTATLEGKPKPDSVTFIWMQGEADTASPDMADVYARSLKGLIAQLRDDLQRPDAYVVIGRISDYAEFPEGSKTVREAEVAVADADPLAAWIDTDDLNGKRNDLHYNAEGYKVLGQRFAARAVEQLKKSEAAGK